MKIRYRLGVTVAAFVLGVTPALAVATKGSGKPSTPGHSSAPTPGPSASLPAKAKAYGKLCQAESKKHVARHQGHSVLAVRHGDGDAGDEQGDYARCRRARASARSTSPARRGLRTASASWPPRICGATRPRAHGASVSAMAIAVPQSALEAHAGAGAACVLPDGSGSQDYHCYTPAEHPGRLRRRPASRPTTGRVRRSCSSTRTEARRPPRTCSTSTTCSSRVLPNPSFQQVFPQGNPQYNNTCTSSKGKSGPCAAARLVRRGDARHRVGVLDRARGPHHPVGGAAGGDRGRPGVPEPVQGHLERDRRDSPGNGVLDVAIGDRAGHSAGPVRPQTAKFDQVFQQGLAKNDNFFAATGDYGSQSSTKQDKNRNLSELHGRRLSARRRRTSSPSAARSSSTTGPGTRRATTRRPRATGTRLPGRRTARPSGTSRGLRSGLGGVRSAIRVYPRRRGRPARTPAYGNHRLVPDTAWNAAVNGGVDVYITAYPEYNCGNTHRLLDLLRRDLGGHPADRRAGRAGQLRATRRQARARSGSSIRSSTAGVGASAAYTRHRAPSITAARRRRSPAARSA